MSAYCTSCGTTTCTGCRRDFDPPRYCAQCGRRVAVTVTPTSFEGRCLTHGVVVGDQDAASSH